jgi:hypothetical protein
VNVLLIVVVEYVDSGALADGDCWCTPPGALGVVVASATGQTVVYRLMISVVTEPILAGQLVTVGAQDVIV